MIIFLLFANLALAEINPYLLKESSEYPICDSSYIELGNLPPVRDQGPSDTCYAHSSLYLLDYLRCHNKPRSCYAQKASPLHNATFDHLKKGIAHGGIPDNILDNFQNVRQMIPNSCAPIEKWLELNRTFKKAIAGNHTMELLYNPFPDYFDYIANEFKSMDCSGNCIPQYLKRVGFNLTEFDLLPIVNNIQQISANELREKILIPQSCKKAPKIHYPQYDIHRYPPNNQFSVRTKNNSMKFINKMLTNGVPLEMSFISERGAHSATIVGQRNVCTQNTCKLQYRLLNSYGKWWQNSFDEGWVEADNLINLFLEGNFVIQGVTPKGKALSEAPFKKYSSSKGTRLTALSEFHLAGEGKCYAY